MATPSASLTAELVLKSETAASQASITELSERSQAIQNFYDLNAAQIERTGSEFSKVRFLRAPNFSPSSNQYFGYINADIYSVAKASYQKLFEDGFIKTKTDVILYGAALLIESGVGTCESTTHFTILKWLETADLSKEQNIPAITHYPYTHRTSGGHLGGHLCMALNVVWDKDRKVVLEVDRALLVDHWSEKSGDISCIARAVEKITENDGGAVPETLNKVFFHACVESFEELLSLQKNLKALLDEACRNFSKEFQNFLSTMIMPTTENCKFMGGQHINLTARYTSEYVVDFNAANLALNVNFHKPLYSDSRSKICRVWNRLYRFAGKEALIAAMTTPEFRDMLKGPPGLFINDCVLATEAMAIRSYVTVQNHLNRMEDTFYREFCRTESLMRLGKIIASATGTKQEDLLSKIPPKLYLEAQAFYLDSLKSDALQLKDKKQPNVKTKEKASETKADSDQDKLAEGSGKPAVKSDAKVKSDAQKQNRGLMTFLFDTESSKNTAFLTRILAPAASIPAPTAVSSIAGAGETAMLGANSAESAAKYKKKKDKKKKRDKEKRKQQAAAQTVVKVKERVVFS